jgi:rRNA maturation endonuclease Nob1
MELKCKGCGEEFPHTKLATSETGHDCCPFCGGQVFTQSCWEPKS